VSKKPVKKKSKTSRKKQSVSAPMPKSLQDLMSAFGGRRTRRSAVEDAQMIMYDAWEAGSMKKAVALAKKALSVSADCADAYNLLAEVADSLEEATELYRQGVGAGERALGKKGFREYAGEFWGFIETRPYMRARAGLARCLYAAEKRDEAVEHYQAMLELNPNDNQGIREVLMGCLIELGRDEDAENLFKRYEKDSMAVWAYARALLDFRKSGDSSQARKSLKKAVKNNPHVPALLTGRRKMPPQLPEYYSPARRARP